MTSVTAGEAARHCCTGLREELGRRLPPGETIFFGPDLAGGAAPEIVRLRERGAHFYWVALPIGRVSFWDAHVGVVVDPETLIATVGIHHSRDSVEAARMFAGLAPVFASRRLVHCTSEAADEEQWNGSPLDVSSPEGVRAASGELVALLEAARTSAR